jgi:hypothetical protein
MCSSMLGEIEIEKPTSRFTLPSESYRYPSS